MDHFIEILSLHMLCVLQVLLQAGKVVTNASRADNGKFHIKIEKRTIDFVEYIEADYVLIATGSSQQV